MNKAEAKRIAHREVANLIRSTEPGAIVGDEIWFADDQGNQEILEEALREIAEYHRKRGPR